MITPEDIKRKALHLYPHFLTSWLQGEQFFPKTIPSSKRLDEDLSLAIKEVHRLRQESKAVCKFGYSVEWKAIQSKRYGRNEFPHRVIFENQSDFLRYIGKVEEFQLFRSSVEKVTSRYPALLSWISSNRQGFVACSQDVDGLLEVVDYLVAHPRPNLFPRELPLSVDTKFIERNKALLKNWLDIVLPPQFIRADEEHFERRYGFRFPEVYILVRFLDSTTQTTLRSPWTECSLPISALVRPSLDVNRVIIVENKVNLLTLPLLPGTIGMGGIGNAISELRYIPWLRNTPIWYWGDLDFAGFMILSRLRVFFPQVRSVLMDFETADAWRHLATAVASQDEIDVPNLTETERAALMLFTKHGLRIEQERFKQTVINDAFDRLLSEQALTKNQR